MKSKLNKLMTIFTIFSLIIIANSCKNKKEIWYCPMHPTYITDRSGQCPICNMDLVKKEIKSQPDEHTGHENSLQDLKKDDLNTVKVNSKEISPSISLSDEKQTLIGIKTTKAEFRNLSKTILAYSRVAYDPELYTAILEYREAKKNETILESGATSENNLSSASVVRLKQLGLSNSQIAEWGNSKTNPDELILGGKNGRAYIYSSIYESDIQFVKQGQKVIFKTDSYPDKLFPGKVQSIDSIVDEKNRTLRFRSFVLDKESILKPQMFGNIEITIPFKRALAIPKSAILNTGKHKVAYIRREGSKFFSVMVKTGIESEQYIEVLEGILEGEEVVVESNFLLDSESKIKLGGTSNEHSH